MGYLDQYRKQYPAQTAKYSDRDLADWMYESDTKAGTIKPGEYGRNEYYKAIGYKTTNPLEAVGLGVADAWTGSATDEFAGNLQQSVRRLTGDAYKGSQGVQDPWMQAAERVQAASRVLPLASGAANWIPHASLSKYYGDPTDKESLDTTVALRGKQEASKAERPWMYYGSGIGSMLPLMAAGGAAAGVSAKGLLPKAAAYAKQAAPQIPLGAAASVDFGIGDREGSLADRVHGANGPQHIVNDAIYGGMFGAVSPALTQALHVPAAWAGRAVKPAIDGVASRLRPKRALDDVAEGIASGDQKAASGIAQDIEAQASDLQKRAQALGLDLTAGEAVGDQNQIRQLFDALDGNKGLEAQNIARSFIERRNKQVPDAVRSVIGAEQRSGAESAGLAQEVLLSAQKSALAKIDKNYEKALKAAGKTIVPGESLKGISDRAMRRVKNTVFGQNAIDIPLDTVDSPNTRQALSILEALEAASATGNPSLETVERLRQSMNVVIQGAQGLDKIAAGSVKKELDNWLDTFLDSDSNNAALAKLKEARESFRIFRQRYGGGRHDDFGAQGVAKSLEHGDSLDPVDFMNQLFGASTLKTNTRAQLENVRDIVFKGQAGLDKGSLEQQKAYREYMKGAAPPPEWQAFREAFINRLVDPIEDALQTNNKAIPATVLRNKLNNLLRDRKEVMDILFRPDEIQKLNDITEVLGRAFGPRPSITNPSGTARVLTAFFRRAIEGIPGIGPVLTQAAHNAHGAAVTRDLLSKQVKIRKKAPPIAPLNPWQAFGANTTETIAGVQSPIFTGLAANPWVQDYYTPKYRTPEERAK